MSGAFSSNIQQQSTSVDAPNSYPSHTSGSPPQNIAGALRHNLQKTGWHDSLVKYLKLQKWLEILSLINAIWGGVSYGIYAWSTYWDLGNVDSLQWVWQLELVMSSCFVLMWYISITPFGTPLIFHVASARLFI
jgi:hypothetical protein